MTADGWTIDPDALDGRSVAIVGGGFGGLSAACYLARAGADVTLLEKNEQLGGRASVLNRAGFRFDMGPSWYLMPDVFERFFSHFGKTPREYYDLEHLDPHYRVFWKDGDRLDLTPDLEETRAAFEAYESGAGDALVRYLERSATTYEVGMREFVYEDRPRFRDYLDWNVARHARGLGLFGSMHDHVSASFDHEKLRQVVQYSLVFLGGSPTNTPAIYSLMSHVDHTLGVHYPDGGIGAVVDGVVELGQELGVTFRTDVEVTQLERVGGTLRLGTTAGRLDAAFVVSDADYAHTEQALLAPEDRQRDDNYWKTRTYAPSAFLLYLGVTGELEELAHHTIVLPTDWDPHFEAIFDEPTWPEDPAYYLCAPSKTDDSVAPDGCSALFALVPVAPGLADGPDVRQAYRDRLLDDLAANTGVKLHDRILVEESFSVSDFASRYNAREGTALGLAHTLRQTGPLRPGHRSSVLEGLYYTGAYTTPGIGVPMCLISGQHAAEALIADATAGSP